MASRPYLLLSGTIFGFVALMHAVRAILEVQVRLGETVVPMWISWFGGIAAASLCAWAYTLAARAKS